MNKIKAMFLAIVVALTLSLASASPANAATSGLCWVGGNTAARLSVSKWIIGYDSVGNAKYRYHMDLNSAGVFNAKTLFFRGTALSSWNDVYKDSWSSPSTITGKWYRHIDGDSVQYYQCSVVV